jgi:PAS domain S-box-containing protein/putative nucleotidyltransferase with HDIG domain
MPKVKILVVEDESIVAEDIKRSLLNLGYEVSAVVDSGEEAVKKAEELKPDLVLLDIVLRGKMNGIDAAGLMRSHFNVPVVYLTAYADEKTLERAKATEPFGYIIKPFSDKELRSVIEIALYKSSMERKLKASEKWLSTILASIGDAVIAADKDGKIMFMNSVAEQLTGWKAEHALGRAIEEVFNVINEKTGERVEDPVKKVLKEGVIVGLANHTVLIRRDGARIPISDSGAPIKDEKGNIFGVVMVFQDITERRRAEELIFLSKQDWEDTFNTITDMITIHDMDFNIIRSNTAAEKILGLPILETNKAKCFKYYHGTDSPPERCPSCQCLKTGIAATFEMFEPHLNMFIEIRAIPRFDSSNKLAGLIHIVRDITERKRTEEKMGQLYENIKTEAEISGSLLKIVAALNSSLDERELIRSVMNIAPKYMKFDRISFFLYSEDLQGFVFSGGYGLNQLEESMALGMTFKKGNFPAIDQVLKGETVIVENAGKSELLTKELVNLFTIGSALMIPISFRGKISGAVYGDYKTVRPIESKDILLLKGLADGMAIALQNSRLYRESVERLMDLSQKIQTIDAMSKLDREILSTLDRKAILRTATALVSRIIPCERAAILLKDGNRCRVISEWGLGVFQDKAYDIKNSHMDAIENTRSSLFIPDHSQGSKDCAYHKELSNSGIISSIIIPLISKGEVIGILDIGSTGYGRLTPAHLSTAERVASQITVALENARLYEDLENLLINTITSLASAVDAKSPWTKGHSERVTKYAVEIAREIGMKENEVEYVRLCGLLHDVGKIGTYDIILDKHEKLTEEEFELVKKHPEKGAEIVEPIKQLKELIKGIQYHHEKYDGTGYPEGLRGEDIPLCARILTVADSFDSMTSDRPYRNAPGKEHAMAELKRCAGTQFDPKIVEAFLKILAKE